jgi:hypothetical protein
MIPSSIWGWDVLTTTRRTDTWQMPLPKLGYVAILVAVSDGNSPKRAATLITFASCEHPAFKNTAVQRLLLLKALVDNATSKQLQGDRTYLNAG